MPHQLYRWSGDERRHIFQAATYKLSYKFMFKTTLLTTWENLEIFIIVNSYNCG